MIIGFGGLVDWEATPIRSGWVVRESFRMGPSPEVMSVDAICIQHVTAEQTIRIKMPSEVTAVVWVLCTNDATAEHLPVPFRRTVQA